MNAKNQKEQRVSFLYKALSLNRTKVPLITADGIQTSIDKAEDNFHGEKDLTNFIIAPPFSTFCIETYSSVTRVHRLIVIGSTRNFEKDDTIKEADFLLSFKVFQKDPTSNGIVHEPIEATHVLLDKTGHIITHENGAVMRFLIPNIHKGINPRLTNSCVSLSLFIMGIMSCRHQIELAPAPFTRQQRRQMERKGEDPNIYKVLRVKAGKHYPALERLLEGKPPVIDKRLHLVRGHFKHYDNLFGKYSGVFYWEPHYRGNESVGKVEKDYLVEMPEGELS